MSKLVALLRRTAPLAVAWFCVPFSAMAEEGMPQLDFGNKLTTSQMVWLAIIFPIFYLLISRWALPSLRSASVPLRRLSRPPVSTSAPVPAPAIASSIR